jgi:hypothetical protein
MLEELKELFFLLHLCSIKNGSSPVAFQVKLFSKEMFGRD